MHELAFTQSLLDISQRHAAQSGAQRVKRLNILLGEFSSFVDDSVQFYWDIISKGTICEGAGLHFERVPARLRCLDCETDYNLSGELTPCPSCASTRVRIVGGEECRLESIDVEAAGGESVEDFKEKGP
jgi:hydrogenase nickel incorporation protein HypA/HybF